jgi:hypothetical protein
VQSAILVSSSIGRANSNNEKVEGPMSNPYRYVGVCIWGGPILFALEIIFWGILGHNIPPYAANLDAQSIAHHFLQHTNQVRVGMIVTITISPLYFVWGLGLTKVMEAVERDNNVLSTAQLWGAGFSMLIILFSCWIWLAAAFRPEALEPNILQLLFDTGWLLFDISFSVTSMQAIAFGVCFLNDNRRISLIPKWVSWYSIWLGVMQVLYMLMPFFRAGPFSRSGIINFWIEFSAFFNFAILATVYALHAIRILKQELGVPRVDTGA